MRGDRRRRGYPRSCGKVSAVPDLVFKGKCSGRMCRERLVEAHATESDGLRELNAEPRVRCLVCHTIPVAPCRAAAGVDRV